MADEVLSFEITIPVGSSRAAPVTFQMQQPSRRVESIEVDVPSGPNGNTGFQIASSGVPVIPHNLGAWIVPNAQHFVWASAIWPSSGDWQLIAYNTGLYPHTLWVRFNVNAITQAAAAAPVPPDLSALSSDAGAGLDLSGTTAPGALGGVTGAPVMGPGIPSVNPPPVGPFIGPGPRFRP